MGGIDVVVPCYQYGGFLTESVDSILSQPVPDLRVLIVDNGSTDNTLEVAQQIARGDSRVQILAYKTNRGQHASYNAGIDWASSEFFMILDADDVMAPGCLSRVRDVLSADQSIAFAHGKELETDVPAAILATLEGKAQPRDWCISRGRDFIDAMCRAGNNIVGATTAVRRTSMQKIIGYYPPELERANDLNMWLRLATLGNVAETKAIQGIRRRHAKQLSEFYRDRLICDFMELFNNFEHFFRNEGGLIRGTCEARRSAKRKIASNALVAGVKRFLKGRVAESGELFDFALHAWRRSPDDPPFAVSDVDHLHASSSPWREFA
ncbi:glycosyltransferase family 2 protein [Methyloceanibacter sp.]|uniref:glycosyltransferase family 2 protein n=1 Tax=Methyloceanibacter sp. TaxID=1965321 RepID=UPI003D6D9B3F